MRIDVLMALISCCLSSISNRSQISHGININQGTERQRAGKVFQGK